MKYLLRTILLMMIIFPIEVYAQSASVTERAGNIYFIDSSGSSHAITSSGLDSMPAISTDGTKIAFIRKIAYANEEGYADITAVYLYDMATGQITPIVKPSNGKDIKHRFLSLSNPVFSLDGGFLYVQSQAWATSDSIQQISLKTKAVKFVIAGNSVSVIRNGPWRGFLLVNQHKYWPEGGSYDPTLVVKPNGEVMFMVPGTQNDDGHDYVADWLSQNGWQAW